MTEWPDKYIHANGIDIHYYRTGGANKPSIILLHGVMDSGQCWPRVAHNLQERFDVIMPDARGHGRTAGSLKGLSYNVLAADVAALIHALDLEKPYFFGHSMGAITAATAAATNWRPPSHTDFCRNPARRASGCLWETAVRRSALLP